MPGITVEPFTAEHAEAARSVINAAFGFERSSAWFAWKHLEGPWGPSRGVIARDADGLLGVRLLLPWRFTVGGEVVAAYRAVDASTAPRARGQGVFSQLNRSLMDWLSSTARPTFVFSTPNKLSRDGHRKLGWTWLDPVEHAYRPAPLYGSERHVGPDLRGPDALESFRPELRDPKRVATAWDTASLQWRFDPRAGFQYEVVAEDDSNGAGLVYRVSRAQRIPILLPLFTWGDVRRIDRLTALAARREKSPVVLDVHRTERSHRLQLRRGDSLLTYWSPDQTWASEHHLNDVRQWRVTFADLESVL